MTLTNQEKNQSIETDIKITQMMEVADKGIKTVYSIR